MNLTLGQIADILHAEGDFASATPVFGYSIDSRSIAAGELYFAVTGERLDGHDFVEAALDAGAAAAVVSTRWVVPAAVDPCKLLRVPDSEDCVLRAMQKLAREIRRKWAATGRNRRVIGITGSAGKTTTKECVAAVLSANFHVLKSAGNLNNGFGLPLQLLKLEPEHEVAVLEMGMNHTGEIAALARIAEPDWAVVSNVAPVHLEHFPDGIAGIAAAKYELVQSLPPEGLAFLNADDPHVSNFGRNREAHTRTFGIVHRQAGAPPSSQAPSRLGWDRPGTPRLASETWVSNQPIPSPADQAPTVHATQIESLGAEGMRFTVHTASETADARIALLGEHNVYNALAAIAVGLESGIPLPDCIDALRTLQPGDKRGELLHLHGAQIVNDSYNSNPRALDSMVDALCAIHATRRIVVAGEMLELGPDAAHLHHCCGEHMRAREIDIVIGVRGHAEAVVQGFQGDTRQNRTALFFQTPEEAGHWLRINLRPGDAVLLKASRGVRLERVLHFL